jgi:HEAT repeat protein
MGRRVVAVALLLLSAVTAGAQDADATRDDLRVLLADPERFAEHPEALLRLSTMGEWDDVDVELAAALLADEDPVIAGCAATALGRQRERALAAVARLADLFPPDDQAPLSGPLPDLPDVNGWDSLRGCVFREMTLNIIGDGWGDARWFGERDGRRYVRTIRSAYHRDPPPPPPRDPGADPDQAARDFEGLTWQVDFHDVKVRIVEPDVRIEVRVAGGDEVWWVRESGEHLEVPLRSWREAETHVLTRSSPWAPWSEVRDHAYRALERICDGEHADAALAVLLRHPSRRMRALALQSFADRPSAVASAADLLRLAATGGRMQRDLAERAFLGLPSGAEEALREAALSGEPQLRSTALSLGVRLGKQGEGLALLLADWLVHGGPIEVHDILRWLGEMGPHAAPAGPALVRHIERKGKFHEDAIRVLGSIGPAAREVSLPVVLHFARTRPGYGHGRLAAVRALARIQPDHPEMPGFLVALCTDPNDNVVEHSLLWVRHLSPPPEGAVEAVMTLARRKRWQARRTCAAALGRMGRGRADVSVVLAALIDDDHPWVQVVAVESLWLVDPEHPRVVSKLKTLLRHDDWNIRWHATMACERIGPGVRRLLLDLRKRAADQDEHGHVRRGARKAIEVIERTD